MAFIYLANDKVSNDTCPILPGVEMALCWLSFAVIIPSLGATTDDTRNYGPLVRVFSTFSRSFIRSGDPTEML